MKDFPAYHLGNLGNADRYFPVQTEDRVHFDLVLLKEEIPVEDRLRFFIENADEEVISRYAKRVRQFHPEIADVPVDAISALDAETITDAYVEVSRKRGSVEFSGAEALFTERNQEAVINAVVTAGKAELLAIAILALYSVEEEANEKRYQERCEREQASLST